MTALISTIPSLGSAATMLVDTAVKGAAVGIVALVVVFALRKQAAAWRRGGAKFHC